MPTICRALHEQHHLTFFITARQLRIGEIIPNIAERAIECKYPLVHAHSLYCLVLLHKQVAQSGEYTRVSRIHFVEEVLIAADGHDKYARISSADNGNRW